MKLAHMRAILYFYKKKACSPLGMSIQQDNSAPLASDKIDFDFISKIVDPIKLKKESDGLLLEQDKLKEELNKVEQRLNFINALLNFIDLKPDTISHLTMVQPKDQLLESSKLTNRNKKIYDLINIEDNWVTRAFFEEKLDDPKLKEKRENNPDAIPEVVRQFIRRARESDVIITHKVYYVFKLNNAIRENYTIRETNLYGLQKFISTDENKKLYEEKLRKRVQELGLFMTQEDAYESLKKNQQSAQTEFELETSKEIAPELLVSETNS